MVVRNHNVNLRFAMTHETSGLIDLPHPEEIKDHQFGPSFIVNPFRPTVWSFLGSTKENGSSHRDVITLELLFISEEVINRRRSLHNPTLHVDSDIFPMFGFLEVRVTDLENLPQLFGFEEVVPQLAQFGTFVV